MVIPEEIRQKAREFDWVCTDCGSERTLTKYDDFPSVTVKVPRYYPDVFVDQKERPLCSDCGSLDYETDDWIPSDSPLTDKKTEHAIKQSDINRFSRCPECNHELTEKTNGIYCSDVDCDGIGSGNELSSERRFVLTLLRHWHGNVDKRFKAFVMDVRREYPELFTPEATPVRLDDRD